MELEGDQHTVVILSTSRVEEHRCFSHNCERFRVYPAKVKTMGAWSNTARRQILLGPGACCIFGTFISCHKMFTSPPRTAARLVRTASPLWATGVKETTVARSHGTVVSASRKCVRHVALLSSRRVVRASFQVVRISSDRRRGEEALALRVDPHEAEHWTV